MFRKILNALSELSPLSAVDTTKTIVEKRMNEVEFGTLGRSLSCNPLTPRAFSALKNQKIKCARELKDIERAQKLYSQNLAQNPQNLGENSHDSQNPQNLQNSQNPQNLAQNPQRVIVIDTTLQKDISLVADARAYAPFLIIHKDIFISKYQILEALVYGADCVALSPIILPQSSITELQNYAYHLGLEVAILANKKEHFTIETRIFVTKKKWLDSAPVRNGELVFAL